MDVRVAGLDGDVDAVLPTLFAAVDAGQPVAVVEPTWPSPARERAAVVVHRATAAGGVGAGDLVLFTSGTSAAPRAVVRSPASWDASVGPLTEVTGVGSDDRVHLAGSVGATLHLYAAWHARAVGAPLVGLLDATAVHCVPSVLRRVLAARSAGTLPALRTVVVAGARTPGWLRDTARSLEVRLVEYYGAAELSFVGVRGPEEAALRPFPGAEVEVRGGVVWARSPYLCRGYAEGSGPLLRDERGFATVGDLVEGSDEAFTVRGRPGATVTTGGTTVEVADVEALVEELPGVSGCVVVGLAHEVLGEELVAVVEGAGLSRADLVAAVATLPAAARPRRWLAAALPRVGAGKVARASVLEGLRSGDLTTRPVA